MADTENKRILLVEDDPSFGGVLHDYLVMNDFEVVLAKDGVAGWNEYQKRSFDLCILDVMMPKKDGFTLAEEIRQKDKEIPLIFLTARSMKDDVLTGFKLGADDYITKPFDSEELLYRVQAILKRTTGEPDEWADVHEFEIGDFHFDDKMRMLTYRGKNDVEMKERKLSPKEAELLRMFCIYKNDVLNRSEALKSIWDEDSYFTARSMDVFITKLRKYLEPDPKIEIVNIHGSGFQLKVDD